MPVVVGPRVRGYTSLISIRDARTRALFISALASHNDGLPLDDAKGGSAQLALTSEERGDDRLGRNHSGVSFSTEYVPAANHPVMGGVINPLSIRFFWAPVAAGWA